MSFRRIGDGLPALVNRWIDDPQLYERVVRLAWERACGSAVSAHTRVLTLKDGVLTVAVDDRRWHRVLLEMRVMLVQRLRDELGAAALRELHIEGPADQAPGEGAPRR